MAICCVQGFVREIYDCLEAAVALADGIAAGARTHGVVSAVSCETRARLDS